jgi:hypothetical protein
MFASTVRRIRKVIDGRLGVLRVTGRVGQRVLRDAHRRGRRNRFPSGRRSERVKACDEREQ